jgi:hypothetical protein
LAVLGLKRRVEPFSSYEERKMEYQTVVAALLTVALCSNQSRLSVEFVFAI